jgi:hypothetical protein
VDLELKVTEGGRTGKITIEISWEADLHIATAVPDRFARDWW